MDQIPLAFGFGSPADLLILMVVVVLAILPTIFWIAEIVDVVRRDFYEPTNKVVWVLVVILLHFVGAAIYYFVGKNQGTLPGTRRLT